MISSVERITHSSAQAEQLQSWICPGMSTQGFQMIPSFGGAPVSKRRPERLIVAFVPVVHPTGRHRHADLVALRKDDEAFIGASLAAVLLDRGAHARSKIKIGHIGTCSGGISPL